MPLLLLVFLIGTAPELPIRNLDVTGNARTQTDTVLRIARLHIGKRVRTDQVAEIRERLMTSGLFSNAKVAFDRIGESLVISIWVQERQTWFIVPSAAFWTGNAGGGVAVGETNMRGCDERLLVYGALYSTDSRLNGVYQDPALLDSYYYGRIDVGGGRAKIDEFNPDLANSANFDSPEMLRRNILWSVGGGAQFGRLLPAHLHTDLYVHGTLNRYEASAGPITPTPPSPDGFVWYGHAGFGYDSMLDVFAVRHGTAAGVWLEGAATTLGSNFTLAKGGVYFARGWRFFVEHNLMVNASAGIGADLPFDFEFEGGGPNLRGYPYRQFRGDTIGEAHVEYVAPLFKIWRMDLRGALFYDTMALWFRDLRNAMLQPDGTYNVRHGDGTIRNFLPDINAAGLQQPPASGFNRDHWHNAVGAGLRVYLRNVNVPLLGVDVGYGVENQSVQVLVAIGVPPG